jgi:selenocysteine lyase/cysteine desulfurase
MEHNIEVPIKHLEGRLYARISVHAYNSIEQYEHLADAVSSLE